MIGFWCFNATFNNISAISWRPVLVVEKPEYPERTTDHGQATGKLYHLRLRVEWTLLCNLQSRARTHTVLVIGYIVWVVRSNDLTHWATPAPLGCIKIVIWKKYRVLILYLLPVAYLESSSTAWITVVTNVFTTEVQNHKCLVWCALDTIT